MEYLGEELSPAATLHEVTLAAGEAGPIYQRLMRNVELILACGRVHGDLSAYSVLTWDGEFWLFDFPQAVDPLS